MESFDSIPGLFVYPDYFTAEQSVAITRETIALYTRLELAASVTDRLEQVHISQPDFVRSSRHNLASDEFYTSVALSEASGREIGCEYFPRYGEDGHALAYFRGNSNLPDYITGEAVDTVRRTMEDAKVVDPIQELRWKLTVNFYKNVGGTVAGFPFHVDIPANGIVTMIMNVQREALFQITRGDAITDIRLPVGSLLVLSGESRYEWKHRVLPMATTGRSAPGDIERVSLVLGFQLLRSQLATARFAPSTATQRNHISFISRQFTPATICCYQYELVRWREKRFPCIEGFGASSLSFASSP